MFHDDTCFARRFIIPVKYAKIIGGLEWKPCSGA